MGWVIKCDKPTYRNDERYTSEFHGYNAVDMNLTHAITFKEFLGATFCKCALMWLWMG